jgi:hypothetical protein
MLNSIHFELELMPLIECGFAFGASVNANRLVFFGSSARRSTATGVASA